VEEPEDPLVEFDAPDPEDAVVAVESVLDGADEAPPFADDAADAAEGEAAFEADEPFLLSVA